MDGQYLRRARTRIPGCYEKDFVMSVSAFFKRTALSDFAEVEDDLRYGSVFIGNHLEKASMIAGSIAKKLNGKPEFEDVIKNACIAESLYEQWEREYQQLFQEAD